jgi:hypothetical protein
MSVAVLFLGIFLSDYLMMGKGWYLRGCDKNLVGNLNEQEQNHKIHIFYLALIMKPDTFNGGRPVVSPPFCEMLF